MTYPTFHAAMQATLRDIGFGHVDADALIERARAEGLRPVPGVVSVPVFRSLQWGDGGKPLIKYVTHAAGIPALKELITRYLATPAEPAPPAAA